MLAASLKKEGHQVVLTREPTHGPAGQKLQSYLLGPSRHLSPAEELDLFMADRREHVAQIIKPALERGKVVLTDRYYYSSVAYQGALGLDPHDILAANEAFAPVPDLVFILELARHRGPGPTGQKGQSGPTGERVLPLPEAGGGRLCQPQGPPLSPAGRLRPAYGGARHHPGGSPQVIKGSGLSAPEGPPEGDHFPAGRR